MKITKENSGDFFSECLGFNAIIGGNSLKYMETIVSESVIGTQHYKYPTNWFNAIIENKDSFSDITISGAYHVGIEEFGGEFEYIIRDYDSFHQELNSNYGNLNGLSVTVENKLKEEFNNLRGVIFFNDSSEEINRKILIIIQ